MTELEAIRCRHSVRSYQKKSIEKEKLGQLQACIEEVNLEGNLHIQLLEDAGKTFNRLLSKAMGLGTAPSVIACVGPDDETLDERVGYFGEKVVLLAQQLGLNTCWAGTYNKKTVPCVCEEGERLVIVIALGYGVDQGRERKSKTAEQVVSGDYSGKPEWFKKGVECALFAPTAVNQQKFEFVLGEDDKVTVLDHGGILSHVDTGIVGYHFEIGAKSVKPDFTLR